MKKVGLLVFFLLIIAYISPKANAAVNDDQLNSPSPTPETVANYELPYPGLLPDSPLYFLRVIRDKTIGFMISDPLKKSEFDLLQADKRLNAGIFLFNKGKISLSLSTVSKAENYFSESLDEIKSAKQQGISTSDLEGKLESALEKHEKELGNLIEKVNKEFKPGFENELKRVAGFEERLTH